MRLPRIVPDPKTIGGTSIFVGTRVPVRILFEHLEAGDSREVFPQDFPTPRASNKTSLGVKRRMPEAAEALLSFGGCCHGQTASSRFLPDELWTFIEPRLATRAPSPQGERPRLRDRAALTGILFVLKTGIPREHLPRELGCGSGLTCWRRLRDWQQAGAWQRLHQAMRHRMRPYDQIHWERARVDSASVPSPHGGTLTGRHPTDRGKRGCQHPLIVDQRGRPLVVSPAPTCMTPSGCAL